MENHGILLIGIFLIIAGLLVCNIGFICGVIPIFPGVILVYQSFKQK